MNERSIREDSRRQFIKRLSVLAVALPGVSIAGTSLAHFAQAREECEWCGAMDAPPNPPSRIVIPPKGEPGESLVISGTVYKEDGKTPASGILIYAYHTNAAGIYPKRTPDTGRPQWRHGYLRGWMRTGKDGRYEFRTIKPGAYPGRTDPAHIHFTVSGTNYPEYPGGFLFAGDPRLTAEIRARNDAIVATPSTRPAVVLTLRRDEQGVLHGAHDIKLERLANKN